VDSLSFCLNRKQVKSLKVFFLKRFFEYSPTIFNVFVADKQTEKVTIVVPWQISILQSG